MKQELLFRTFTGAYNAIIRPSNGPVLEAL